MNQALSGWRIKEIEKGLKKPIAVTLLPSKK
jgi:hypothetical protein